jgi:hypothetical protein
MLGAKNPRWDKHEEDDAAEKGANERVRVLPWPNLIYL